ncbi:MAG: endonuclease/exonuclease/phosphatase family protein [Planctomycetaceae bacterium]
MFFALFAIINLYTIVPLYFGRPAIDTPAETVARSSPLRALQLNVNTRAGNAQKVGQLIARLDPDLIVLEEVSSRWLQALATALEGYPYSIARPRDDNFGIAVFSRLPLANSEIRHLGEADVPTVIVEVEAPERPFTLIATHPLPPGGAEYSRLRNDQLARLPAVVREAKSPVLLVGDLNATPWCSCFRRLLRETALVDSSQGRGVMPTWPTHIPVLLIPIDHCLHSPEIRVLEKSTGPDVDSDHYPLIIEFVLTTGR